MYFFHRYYYLTYITLAETLLLNQGLHHRQKSPCPLFKPVRQPHSGCSEVWVDEVLVPPTEPHGPSGGSLEQRVLFLYQGEAVGLELRV